MTTTVENPYDTQQSSTSSQGIIGGTINTTPTESLQGQSYNAQTTAVNQATDTTSGQLNSILASDSPLMQRARSLAMQQSNSRGLVNSSIGAGAGTAAMIDAATPIATADAGVYDTRAKANQDATNTAGMFNVNQNNSFVQQNASIAATMAQQKDQQEYTGSQAALDRTQQTAIQTGQQDFTASQSALDRTQATSTLQAQQTFTAAQSELERAQQTAIADKSSEAQMALQTAQQNYTAAQAALDRTQATYTQQAQLDSTASLQESQQQFTAMQNQLSVENQQALATLQNSFTTGQVSAQFSSQTAATTLSAINTIQMDSDLTAESKRNAIANIIASANVTMQWAATFYNTPMPAISAAGTSTTMINPNGTSPA